MFLAPRGSAATRLFAVSALIVVATLACNRDDVTSPNRMLLRGKSSRDLVIRPVTYAHSDRGPCYVWGPTPPDNYNYTTWSPSWPEPTAVSVCGVQVSFEARPYNGGTDDRVVSYTVFGKYSTDSVSKGTWWQSEQDNWYTLETSNPQTFFAQFADPIYVHFTPAVKEVHVLWACSTRSGNTLTAYDSAGNVLTQVPVPYSAVDPNTDCSLRVVNETVIAASGIRTLQMMPASGSGRASSTQDQPATYDPAQNYMLVEISKIVPEQRIHVACAGGALHLRRSMLTCTASASGNLSVTGWTFLPTNLLFKQVSVATDSARWEGLLVADGRITVHGRIDGDTASADTVDVAVYDRPGFKLPIDTGRANDTVPVIIAPQPGSGGTSLLCLDTMRAYNNTAWGITAIPGHCKGYPQMFPNPDVPSMGSPVTMKQVLSGPNRGFWYVDSLVAKYWVRAEILSDLIWSGSFYPITLANDSAVATGCYKASGKKNNPPPGYSLTNTVNYVNVNCMAMPSYSPFVNQTWRHEGCHMARTSSFYSDSTDAKDGVADVTNVASDDSLSATLDAIARAKALRDRAREISKAIDDSNPTPHAYPLWLPTAATGHWAVSIQGDDISGIFPTSLCK